MSGNQRRNRWALPFPRTGGVLQTPTGRLAYGGGPHNRETDRMLRLMYMHDTVEIDEPQVGSLTVQCAMCTFAQIFARRTATIV